MQFLRNLFIILFFSFGLMNCTLPGTRNEGEISTENTILYETQDISLLVPKNWSGVTNNALPNPRIGNLLMAYVSPEIKSGYSNNLIILEDTLSRITTSAKYSEINQIQTTKNYLEYKKIKEESFVFSDDEPSKIYIFEARYNQTTPRMNFIQTARVCGTKVYLLHFALSTDKDPDIYAELLKSFTCK